MAGILLRLRLIARWLQCGLSMHKPVLVVTTRFMDQIEARINRDYDARRNPHESPFTSDELIEASSGADALFITPLDRLDVDFFNRMPASVKVIATYSVGIDHIDLEAAATGFELRSRTRSARV